MKKIGFIGAGNMATAIIGSLMGQNDGKADFINVFDLDKEKCDIMSKKGINIKKSAADVMLESDITVLAVKPQNYPEVLEALKSQVTADKVFVSIAAGISIAYVQNLLDCKCPVVRVMPNTPLLLGKGASAAYIYLFAKAMADYAQECGIDYDKAMNLICATLEGSAKMLKESGDSVDTLIEKVSSKGGTTIAALDAMKDLGFYDAVKKGMAACTKRAEELGK